MTAEPPTVDPPESLFIFNKDAEPALSGIFNTTTAPDAQKVPLRDPPPHAAPHPLLVAHFFSIKRK